MPLIFQTMATNKNASDALERLLEGNHRFLNKEAPPSHLPLPDPAVKQEPYCVVLACSDSRVAPEAIFCAGYGELFVIRVAGNVLADAQRSSIEFAVAAFGAPLVLVLGHTFCGAIDAALKVNSGDSVPPTLTEIAGQIAGQVGSAASNPEATEANAAAGAQQLRDSEFFKNNDTEIRAAVYDLASGKVNLLD